MQAKLLHKKALCMNLYQKYRLTSEMRDIKPAQLDTNKTDLQ